MILILNLHTHRYKQQHLHVSLELFEQCGVFIQSHEGFTQVGGEGENPRTACTFTLHKLTQLLTVRTHTHTQWGVYFLK